MKEEGEEERRESRRVGRDGEHEVMVRGENEK